MEISVKNLGEVLREKYWECIFIFFLFFMIPYPGLVNVINWVAAALFVYFLGRVVRMELPDLTVLELTFFIFSLIYLLIYPISLVWTENIDWGQQLVERHWYFLLIPVLLVVGRYCSIHKMIDAFIFSMMIVELVSYGVWLGLWRDPEGYGTPSDPVAFNPHTVYTYLASFAYFLIVWKLLFEKNLPWSRLFLYVFFSISITANVFLNGGRGGQIAWVLMTLVLCWAVVIRFRFDWRRAIFVFSGGIVLISVVLVSAYFLNPTVKQRVDLAFDEMTHYSPKSAGSWSYRLHMYHNTLEMLKHAGSKQLLIGTGIGDFPEVYNQYVDPQQYRFYLKPDLRGHFHPHNQFLFDLGSTGLIGLIALLGMLGTLGIIVWKLRTSPAAFVLGVGFILMSIWMMMPDSLLLSRSTQLLFILFSYVLIRLAVDEKVAV